MGSCRMVVVSDTHLSVRTPEAQRNWSSVLRHVEATRPDLVVHVGDVSLDGTRDADDLRHARALLDLVSVPWRAVPGNHDIGDNATPDLEPDAGSSAAADVTVNGERVDRWRQLVGEDYWSTVEAGWRLLGVNAQLFGSGSSDETQHWAFLEAELEGPPLPTVLVIHKPLAAGVEELASAPSYRFVPAPARRRLLELCQQGGVELVVSGHVHQSRRLAAAGMAHLWAPTTWAVLPDWLQPRIGLKRCGILEVELREGGAFDARCIEPAGMEQLTLGENVASPYASEGNPPS